MIAARFCGPAEPRLRDGPQQQRHAQQLEEEGPRLADMTPASGRDGLFGGHPEPQGGNHLPAARPVEEIEGHGEGRDGAEHAGELEQGEVD